SLLARVWRLQERARAIGLPEAEALGPRGFLPDHFGGRQHVGRLREARVAVEIAMARSVDVPAGRRNAERAVGSLGGVRMHGLVRQEEREGLRALAVEEPDRKLVHD